MRLIGRYNFAKAQNPQTGESIKIKTATVGLHATKKSIKSIKLNYVKLN
jgi:nucleoid DNA-binding protein